MTNKSLLNFWSHVTRYNVNVRGYNEQFMLVPESLSLFSLEMAVVGAVDTKPYVSSFKKVPKTPCDSSR